MWGTYLSAPSPYRPPVPARSPRAGAAPYRRAWRSALSAPIPLPGLGLTACRRRRPRRSRADDGGSNVGNRLKGPRRREGAYPELEGGGAKIEGRGKREGGQFCAAQGGGATGQSRGICPTPSQHWSERRAPSARVARAGFHAGPFPGGAGVCSFCKGRAQGWLGSAGGRGDPTGHP